MWNRVYDANGHYIDGGFQRFKSILRTEFKTSTKIEMLDTSFHAIDGGDLYSADVSNRLTNFVTDGSIDVDVSRGTRRTAEITLLNPTADFTPNTDGFSSDGDWVGKIYLDRIIRIWRGVYDGNHPIYVPVGTFFVDNIDVQVEQNMSQVVLTLSDRWKVFTKSIIPSDVVFKKGTEYNHIIAYHCDAVSINQSERTINPITNRDHTIDADVRFKSGDNRGDALLDLAKKWNLDMYFDPLGRFHSENRVAKKDKETVWEYYSSDDREGMLVSIQRSFNDDNLYNHVVVIGMYTWKSGSNQGTKPFRVERKNNNPASKTSIQRIGDRVLYIRDDRLNTEDKARNALDKAWEARIQMSESMSVRVISNPMLEADDVIKITERNLAKLDDRYRVSAFDIPLVTSLQTIQVNKILREEDVL